MTYLISIPLIKHSQIKASTLISEATETHNLIKEIQSPKASTKLILPNEPFSSNLKTQLTLWEKFLRQNPQIAKLAEAFTNVYTEVNNEHGFRLKLDDNFGLLLKPQGQIAVSFDDNNGYLPVENTLQETISKHLKTAETVIFLRELRAINLLAALKGKEDELEFKSVVTQVSRTPTEVPKRWRNLCNEIKQVSQDLNSADLPKAISWLSQVISAIPPDSPLVQDSAHLSFLRQVGILNENNSLNLPNTEQLEIIRPAISSFFIGMLEIPNMSSSPNYPSNFHTMAIPGNLNGGFDYIPTGLTTVSFRGEAKDNSEEQDTKIWTNDQLKYQIKTLPAQEFAGAILKDTSDDIAKALKSISFQDQVDKNIVHTIANQFQKQNPSQKQIQTILTNLANQKPHLLQVVLEAIYLGKKTQGLSLKDAQNNVDVSRLTNTSASILKDLGDYTFSLSIEDSNALNLAAKLAGSALRIKPSDPTAQYLMAKINIKQKKFKEANVLLNQVLSKNTEVLQAELAAETHLLRAYASMQLASVNREHNPIHLSNMLLKLEGESFTKARKDLEEAFALNPNLKADLLQQIESLKNEEVGENNSKSISQREALLYLLLCAEPNNIKLHVDLIKLYSDFKYRFSDWLPYEMNCRLGLLNLLNKGIHYSGEHPNRQELVTKLVSFYEKGSKWASLKTLFGKEPVQYIQEVFPDPQEQAQLLISLALAFQNSTIEQEIQTKANLISTAGELFPDIQNKITEAFGKVENKTEISIDERVTAAKYRLFYEPGSEEAMKANTAIYVSLLTTSAHGSATKHLKMLCNIYGYPKVLEMIESLIKQDSFQEKSYGFISSLIGNYRTLLDNAPKEIISKQVKVEKLVSIADLYYNQAKLSTLPSGEIHEQGARINLLQQAVRFYEEARILAPVLSSGSIPMANSWENISTKITMCNSEIAKLENRRQV